MVALRVGCLLILCVSNLEFGRGNGGVASTYRSKRFLTFQSVRDEEMR